MTLERRIEIERLIVKKICDDAIAKGYLVSLHDGECFVVKRTRDVTKIMENMMATDEEQLWIRSATGEYLGHVFLVYGNSGWDVINNHSDNAAINDLLVGANDLAEAIENEEYKLQAGASVP
jgi:hypothetical protein